jgi:hypothetical protein
MKGRQTIMVEFTPEEAIAISDVLRDGYARPSAARGFFSGRDRLDRAIRIEKGPGGFLHDEGKRAA